MIQLLTGTIHDVVTDDLQKALLQDATAAKLWQSLTPLARNEWICWVISPKKQEMRTVVFTTNKTSYSVQPKTTPQNCRVVVVSICRSRCIGAVRLN